ncbi:autotransporter outer membrane beta-barrel domain-containing protein [Salmonella enterica subsp. enterica serovar Oranienburg]|nr:autotransporter outer membrane beta-barrel domain-containing protein [Salmonella enterica subsp. enterica serovar Oranienburg]
MNRIFTTVWSESRQQWVVAPELASGGGRPKLTPKKSALALLLGAVLLQSGPVMAKNYTDETLENALQSLNAGDSATNTTVNSGGVQAVNSGGTATHTTVNYGGQQDVNDGGTATDTTVNYGGWQDVNDGGTATHTTVNEGGRQDVNDGGTATHTTVNEGGRQNIYSGGTATDTTLNGGRQDVNDGGTATRTTLNSWGWQHIYSGGTATHTTVNNGGWQHIYSGGTATDTTVNEGGQQDVNDGGTATHTTVNNGGVQVVDGGGTATHTTVNNGGVQVVDGGGTATHTTVNNGGLQSIDGGTATNTTVNGGLQHIYNGGTATDTILNGGQQHIYNGGTATDTTVNNGGWQDVNDGGTATDTTVNEGGKQDVSYGGTATDTTVNEGGKQNIYSGGTATDTTLNGGLQHIYSGGTANDTTVNNGGVQAVDGGTATNTTVNSGGLLQVTSGGQLSGTTTLGNGGELSGSDVINNGNIHYLQHNSAVYQGNLSGTGLLTQDGGSLTLQGTLRQEGGIFLNSGGVMTMDDLQAVADITAESGTQLHLTGNTTLTGKIDPTDMTVNSGATWNMTGDSVLDSLSHAGSINFIHTGSTFTPMTLTTTNFTGNGGTLTLHSVLGDSTSLTDRLVIDGGQATGNTRLVIVNNGGLGAPTTGNGITVVDVINGATTTAGAFAMTGPLDAGAYRYSLYRNANESWYLTTGTPTPPDSGTPTPPDSGTPTPPDSGTPTPPDSGLAGSGGYSNAAWLYTSLAGQAMDYDRQVLGDRDSRRSVLSTDPQTGQVLWGRMHAGSLSHDRGGMTPSGDMAQSRSHYAFIQMGGDVWVQQNSDAVWRAGLYGAIGSNRGDVTRGDDGRQAGNMSDTVYTGGLYLSGDWQNGAWLDTVAQFSRHNVTTSTAQKTSMSTAGTGIALSAEGGWTVAVTPGLYAEPQLQYVWQTQQFNDAMDSRRATWRSESSQSHQVRAGVRLGNTVRESRKGGDVPFSLWVKPSVIQTFGSRGSATTGMSGVQGSDLSFSPDRDGTALSAEAGMDVAAGSRGTIGLRAGYTESVQGSAAGGYYGQINLKIRF